MKYSYTSSEGKNFPAIILASTLVLVLGAVVALYFTGFLKVGDNVATTSQSGLCKDVIVEYNSAFTATSADEYTKKLADSAKSASEVKNNASDPNCVFIQFINAGFTANVSEATKFADTLTSLSKEGKYITGELANPQSIDSIQKSVQSLKGADGSGTPAARDGNG